MKVIWDKIIAIERRMWISCVSLISVLRGYTCEALISLWFCKYLKQPRITYPFYRSSYPELLVHIICIIYAHTWYPQLGIAFTRSFIQTTCCVYSISRCIPSNYVWISLTVPPPLPFSFSLSLFLFYIFLFRTNNIKSFSLILFYIWNILIYMYV